MSDRYRVVREFRRAQRNLINAENDPSHRADWLHNLRVTCLEKARAYVAIYGTDDLTNGEIESLNHAENAVREEALKCENPRQSWKTAGSQKPGL